MVRHSWGQILLILILGAVLLVVGNVLMYQWDKMLDDREKRHEQKAQQAVDRMQYEARQEFIRQNTQTPQQRPLSTPREVPLPRRP